MFEPSFLIHGTPMGNASEVRIRRLALLYKALSEVNQAIVRLQHETDLFPLVCRIAVNFGGIKMAWIGTAAWRRRFNQASGELW